MRLTVKLGGSVLEDAQVRRDILLQVAWLAAEKHEVILVHGGGMSLSRRLAELNIPSRFVNGLRVTDLETLGVAVMVLAGEVNKRIVAELDGLGMRAVGICGADGGAVRCVPMAGDPGDPVGLGYVGRPVQVDPWFFHVILEQRMVPVVSSIALGSDSRLYNVNADQMASACAWGTGCEALIYLTDVPGVRDEDGAVVAGAGRAEVERLRKQGAISGGMLPKTTSCLESLERGVSAVYILPGTCREVLKRFAEGTLSEGTCIHEDNKRG